MVFKKNLFITKKIFIPNKRIISGLVFLIFGAFLMAVLVSYNPYDNSWCYYTSREAPITNIGGSFGAQYAAFLFYLFGSSSLLIVVLLFFVAYILLCKRFFLYEFDRLCGFFALPFISAALCYTYACDFFKSTFPGGLLGSYVRTLTVRLFDELGSTIFLISCALICCILVLRISFITIGKYSIRTIRFFCSRDRFLRPTYCYGKISVHFLARPCVFCFKHLLRIFNGSIIYETSDSVMEFEHDLQEEEIVDISDDTFWQKYFNTSNTVESFPSVEASEDHAGEYDKQIKINNLDEKKIVTSPVHGKKREHHYKLPRVDMFESEEHKSSDTHIMNELEKRARVLEEKLERFGVFGTVISIKRGPVVTLFEYQPHIDSKISKIIALEDDLALALQALSIRIIAPIPGRSVVGFEVANSVRNTVLLADVIKSKIFRNFSGWLPLILGQDTVGNDLIVDLAKMPHLLIAGSTGSGKSVALNSMLVSLLCRCTPDELRLVLIDPKRLEFAAYADIAHLLFPIITAPKQVAPVLKWVVKHMEERYEKMTEVGARNIFDYNAIAKEQEHYEQLPFIVVIIDELADLMMTAGRDIEDLIARITQMARAAGIHMIVATQRPSVDVITGLIKVNFPSRISFRVTSKIDSRTILDCSGADKLLGRGDMLFLDSHEALLKRVHGAYVSNKEIQKLVAHVRAERKPEYHELTDELMVTHGSLLDGDDELYHEVLNFLQDVDEVSISLLQRRFRIGYNRSARIINILESQGLIAPSEGGKTRRVIR